MRILVFGIHPDDIEFCCGGTVALAVKLGHEVVMADLTDGGASSNGTIEQRAREAETAAEILGVGERVNLGFADTEVQSESLEQARTVVNCIRRYRPELVLAPHRKDTHPDHISGGILVERAIYLSGIHGFRTPEPHWAVPAALMYMGRSEFEPDLIVDITSTYDIRLRSIQAHQTQIGGGDDRNSTPINSVEFLPLLEARARTYGFKIGVKYGEPFQSLRPLPLKNFDMLGS
jgi:bacillithiol biosynthesis deacetylase BshB1